MSSEPADITPSRPPTETDISRHGKVVTFYSYKGGVGRSMALANIAWLLAEKYGKNVIVVDWDLEAPGLHRFFRISDRRLRPGVVDYLTSYQDALRRTDRQFSQGDLLLEKYLSPIRRFNSGGSIRLMSAGQQRDRAGYVEKIRTFDWQDFYDNWNGAQLIEAMRTQFQRMADITLIDSRTGVTDIGGVCTVQLPDIVVFVFVFNLQNIDGIETVAAELSDRENPILKVLGRWPTLHFLPSRKEVSEIRSQRRWEGIAEKKFARFCSSLEILKRFGSVVDYLRALSVPYVPNFAYGEEIAARTVLGIEISRQFDRLVRLLLEPDIESALETVERYRASRQSRIAAAAAILALPAVTDLVLGFFDVDPSVLVAQGIPLLRAAFRIAVCVSSGISGGLFAIWSKRNRPDPANAGRGRPWSETATRVAVGAIVGVVCLLGFGWTRWVPLISLVAASFAGAVLDAISITVTATSTHSDIKS